MERSPPPSSQWRMPETSNLELKKESCNANTSERCDTGIVHSASVSSVGKDLKPTLGPLSETSVIASKIQSKEKKGGGFPLFCYLANIL